MSVTLPAGVSPRSRWPEVMDLPSLEAAHHAQALRGLGRVHAVTGTVGQAARPLVRLQRRLGRALRVIDLACGRGDIARALERRLRREQPDAVVDGVDLSDTAVGLAQVACERAGAFAVCDVIAGELPSGYDAAVNTVFLHHLSESDVLVFLRKCAVVHTPPPLSNDRESRGHRSALTEPCVHTASRSIFQRRLKTKST